VRTDFFAPDVEAAATLGTGAREDQSAHQAGAHQDDFLCNESAAREAEQLDPREAEGVDEREGVASETLDGVRGA
jgi:hypothetical protein